MCEASPSRLRALRASTSASGIIDLVPRALILGGTGQIGRATASRLRADGWEVTAAARNPGGMPPELTAEGSRSHGVDRREAGALAGRRRRRRRARRRLHRDERRRRAAAARAGRSRRLGRRDLERVRVPRRAGADARRGHRRGGLPAPARADSREPPHRRTGRRDVLDAQGGDGADAPRRRPARDDRPPVRHPRPGHPLLARVALRQARARRAARRRAGAPRRVALPHDGGREPRRADRPGRATPGRAGW